ncbi:hypothetical protein DPEC_G00017020 [Dallia pectoralis]|uniref:Uncharacterized protein n=1 Tax=Dallia pectoralis TaxID=75939 RepID=A0ACC2HN14_DALPE|nr:hypothetical protein DPEC_G00017020 [Dallia pectoralis]
MFLYIVPCIFFLSLCSADDEAPVPSLTVQSGWLEVFPLETVVLSCDIQDKSSAWLYSWSRNGQILSEKGATLSISSPTQSHSGTYKCSTTLTSRPASTKHSNTHTLHVYPNSPIASLLQSPGFEVMYVGEGVSFSCNVFQSSGWQYMWFKDAQITDLTKTGYSQTSYTIKSASLKDSGTYSCRATRGNPPFNSQYSQTIKMEVREAPVPSLTVQTGWLEVFPLETVVLSCDIQDESSAWLYSWSRNGQILSEKGATLSISSPTQSSSGTYKCSTTLTSRPASTKHSNTHTLHVYPNSPIASLLQSPGFEVMYVGEGVSFSCNVSQSSGWQYMWFKDAQITDLTKTGYSQTSYTIKSASLKDSGTYSCRATRGNPPFNSQYSQTIKMEVREAPVPSLTVQTGWLEVFPLETVVLSCDIQDESSAWLYSWSRNGQILSEKGATLSISSPTQSNSGTYKCSTTLTSRPASTKHSNTHTLHVYPNSPIASLLQSPGFEVMYVGEGVSFSCNVFQSSGWQYMWFKDSQITDLTKTGYSQTSYTIKSASLKDSGTYSCRATRGNPPFNSQYSQTIKMEVRANSPIASLLQSPGFEVMYVGEGVSFSCNVSQSSGWQYMWFKDSQITDLTKTGYSQTSYTIKSASLKDSGTYSCRATRGNPPFNSQYSQTIKMEVRANSPIASLLQSPGFEVMYVGEGVSFSCNVSQSSGWQYMWFKDSQITDLTKTGYSQTSYTIKSASLKDSGTYSCRATRGNPPFNSQYSQTIKMEVREAPVPSLTVQSGWLEVFPLENVVLSCDIQDESSAWLYSWSRNGQILSEKGATLSISSPTQSSSGTYKCSTTLTSRPASTKHSNTHTLHVYPNSPIASLLQSPRFEVMYVGEGVSFSCNVSQSSGWQYMWFKDSQITDLTKTGYSQTSYTIKSASLKDSGTYSCRATRGNPPFNSQYSQTIKMEVRVRPLAEITLETGWDKVFSTDDLALKCDVLGNHANLTWNYTWYREEEKIIQDPAESQERYIVTLINDPTQSAYSCEGTRMERPSYSTRSETFKTRNLVLKRKVLLSISGCLFFGIVLVFFGCIFLRFTRKPEEQSKTPERNLFLSIDQLKSHTPSPLEEYVTELDICIHNKDTDDDAVGRDICELSPLPISHQDDPAILSELPVEERTGGMVSFSS